MPAPLPTPLPHSICCSVSEFPCVVSIPGHLSYVQNLGLNRGLNGYTYRWPDTLTDLPWSGMGVLHFHTVELFTFEELLACLDLARAHRIPVVMTVHDLVPNIESDLTEFRRKRDLVARAADAVITLTAEASARLFEETGVAARVLSHGTALPLHVLELRAGRPTGDEWAVFGALRTNRDLATVVTAWRALSVSRPPLRVLVRSVGPADEARDGALLDFLRESASTEKDLLVDIRPQSVPAEELCDWLAPAGTLVLPYRQITHSGQLELGRDLGLRVLAPDVPTLREQACLGPRWDDTRWYPTASLARAPEFTNVLASLTSSPSRGRSEPASLLTWRRAEHVDLVAAHQNIYCALTEQATRELRTADGNESAVGY